MSNQILGEIEDKFIEPFNADTVLFHARFETPTALTQTALTRTIFKRTTKPSRRRDDNERASRILEIRDSIKDGLVLALQERASEFQSQIPIIHPVWAMCLFFYTPATYYNESGVVSRRTPSLINLIDFATRSLVKSNIIYSPKLIQSHDGSRKLVGDKNAVEIFLLPYDVENNRKKFTGGEFRQA